MTPAHKAPGPDGFTAEFLRACWGIVRQDFIDVFQQLFELRGRGFYKLNQALLTLLLKHAAPNGLLDYIPISSFTLWQKSSPKCSRFALAPSWTALSAATKMPSS